MNIGIDARSMFGRPTGVGRYLSNLLTHLRFLDTLNQYWLYTDRFIAEPIVDQANFHQKLLRLPVAQNYFTWNHFRLPPELWRYPIDLFHFPFYTMPVFRNYKSIVTIHDITYEIHPEWYDALVFYAVSRMFGMFAHLRPAWEKKSIFYMSEFERMVGDAREFMSTQSEEPIEIEDVYYQMDEGIM